MRSPRRAGRIAALAVALLGALALASCGGDAEAVTASLQSAPRPTIEQDAGGGGELSPDTSVPAPLPEDLPDAQQFTDCVELTAAYAEVQVLAFTGDPDGSLGAQFDLLEAAAPDDVLDDLATVRSTIEGLGGDAGVLDATQALLSEEYTAANEAIINWLTSSCGG